MIIRTETKDDYSQVYELNDKAFGNRDNESKLIEQIRLSEQFIPELSIVAEADKQIIGHILLSRAKVVDQVNDQLKEYDVIVLAPIAVSPDYQKQGVGTQLMMEGMKRTKQLNYSIILLIGHPAYYPKFGFKPARNYGIELTQFKVSDEVFMVCELIEGQLKHCQGELQYPNSFFS
ncbi:MULTISPECIES: GNAT family N-acetyltransferase [unclassified Paenibacillus]|uniref:GNAT family N-acetyltransferase n=1 Tax=unclassified Paenibacillus TaxID=185978 RepID=UPI003627E851